MKQTRTFISGVFVGPLVLVGLTVVFASDASLPHTFTSGTPAVAAEVNANLEALRAAINDNHARIQAIESLPSVMLIGTSQAIPDDVDTDLVWSEATSIAPQFSDDPSTMHSDVTDPELVTIPRDGQYQLSMVVTWATNSTGYRQLRLIISPAAGGGISTPVALEDAGSMFGNRQRVVRMLKLAAGDTLKLQSRQDTGGDLNVTPTLFGVTFIRP